jgi:hypothetical protein
MSIESFSPLPLNIFGSWVTLLDPSDVPAGMSPSLADVEFFPGGVRTRAGLVSQFTPLAGAPQINGVKTYATTNLLQRFLALDSFGNIYKETSPGVLSLGVSGVAAGMFMASTTQFGRRDTPNDPRPARSALAHIRDHRIRAIYFVFAVVVPAGAQRRSHAGIR